MHSILAQQGNFMWYDNGHMVGMHWVWWIFWIGFLLILVVLVARTVGGAASGGGPSAPPVRSAEEVLRERFANGELSEEEFRQRMKVLRES